LKLKQTPINQQVVKQVIDHCGIPVVGKATIRELVKIVNQIESLSGQKFIRMEMGIPGIAPPQIGVDAEIEALRNGVASQYANIEGIPILKEETSRFIKNFMNLDIPAEYCIPTIGSMQASIAAIAVGNRADKQKNKTLFIDPGFPVHKLQVKALGLEYEAFDVYEHRGEKLKDILESYLSKGDIATILYSNPNNPSWICFNEQELSIIGEMANKYEVIILEDLAYFAMDFRKDYSVPGMPPFQPSIARYTDQYILLLSSSKSFSYAGQRIGCMAISPKIFHRKFTNLFHYFRNEEFGHALIYGCLYSFSAGVSHSAQYGLAAMFKASNDGVFDFVSNLKEYMQRAKAMKELFVKYGFHIVYDKDLDENIGDGFYFTFARNGFSGSQLTETLLYYGISAISLEITGSLRSEGLRACVSLTDFSQFPLLEERLKAFNQDYAKIV